MRKLILVAHISCDGFVAGKDGGFDNFIDGAESLEFVCSLTDEADAALFGRVSYELLNSNWPTAANKPDANKNVIKYSNWYNKAEKFVLSKTLTNADVSNAHIISENIAEHINVIKTQPGKNILIFGSPGVVHSLLELDLIDGFWLIVHPVLFGTGIPLFREINKVTKLDLLKTKQLAKGMIALNYILPNA